MSAPVPHTCGVVDKILYSIKESIKYADAISKITVNFLDGDELEAVRFDADSISSELYYLEDELEALRDANSKLRDWGEEMESERDELQKQLSNYED